MTNTTTNYELITIKEAAKLLNKSQTSVRTYINDGRLDTEYQNVTKVYKHQVLALKDIFESVGKTTLPFGTLYLEKNESIKFLDNFNDPHIIGNPHRYMTRCKYGVTNKGRIINLTLNHVLTPQTVDHKYKQTKIGKMLELVHAAVASQWCPNGKYKSTVHHIDGNRVNNNADNLIYVTDDEHTEAHRLLDIARKSGDWQEYNQYIKTINENNQWCENIRVIISSEDGDNTKYLHVWFVSEQGYIDYKNGNKSFDDLFSNGDIRAEGYYKNSNEQN